MEATLTDIDKKDKNANEKMSPVWEMDPTQKTQLTGSHEPDNPRVSFQQEIWQILVGR